MILLNEERLSGRLSLDVTDLFLTVSFVFQIMHMHVMCVVKHLCARNVAVLIHK